jgi:hypothetical protein
LKGSEFKRKVEKLARARGVMAAWEGQRGKGSHGRLFFGQRFTTLKDLRKEIGAGLLKAMCGQLGITREELYDLEPTPNRAGDEKENDGHV